MLRPSWTASVGGRKKPTLELVYLGKASSKSQAAPRPAQHISQAWEAEEVQTAQAVVLKPSSDDSKRHLPAQTMAPSLTLKNIFLGVSLFSKYVSPW